MLIPLGNNHTATASGSIGKQVDCECCRHRYSYVMSRTAMGGGFSFLFLDESGAESRARESAQARLKKVLDTECDSVSCPVCGIYQRNMVPLVKAQHRAGLRTAGVLVLIAGVFSDNYPSRLTTIRFPVATTIGSFGVN